MGNYLTVSDVAATIGVSRLSLLCSDGNGGVATSAVSTLITDAEAEVDSILGPAFTVPKTGTIPSIVKRCARSIAIDFAYRNVTEFRDSGGRTPTHADFDAAIKTLKEIRNGERDCGDETAAGKSALSGGVVYTSDQSFIVDSTEDTTTPSGGF